MTHRRPPPPRRQRYVWPLLGGAAFVGLCGLMLAVHPVVQADAAPVTVTPVTVSPSVALQAPSRSAVRSLSPAVTPGTRTVTQTVVRDRQMPAVTRTAFRTSTSTTTAMATVTALSTVTATTTVTATVTATVTTTATVTASPSTNPVIP